MSRPSDIPQDVWDAASNNVVAMPQRSPFKMDVQRAIAIAIMAERERAAKVCEEEAVQFLSPQYAFNQPFGSLPERFACEECAAAIRKGTP